MTTTPAASAVDRPAPSLSLIGALYVAQGVPLGFAFEALPVLLRSAEAPLSVIALLPLAALPWVLKLLWAPFVDNHGSAALGHRRGWILAMQAVLAVSLALIALFPLGAASAPWAIGFVLLGVVAASTQDIATDGLAAETLDGRALAWANALQVGGMMAGFMMGGAGLLLLTDLAGYRIAMATMVLLLLLALVPVVRWTEGPRRGVADGAVPARRAGILAAFRRPAIWPLLLIVFSYGTLYTGGMALSKLILTDAGWSLGEVGGAAILCGLSLIVLGGPAGSWVAARHGIWPALAGGLAVVGGALLLWLLIVWRVLPAEGAAVMPAMIALGAGGGMASVATYTLIMRFAAHGEQAGTDVTVLQSANVLSEMLISSAAMGLAAAFGYGTALLVNLGCLAAVLLVVALVARMAVTRSLTGPAAGEWRSLGDRLTDHIARRPGGWIGRRLYRRASAHQQGFGLALSVVPVGPGDRVLDVGCGGGAFLARVLANGADGAGIDHSVDMVETTKAQNAVAIAAGRLEVRQGDAARLPFADGTFSHVFCMHAFFFFPDPAASIAEMGRVLAPGGTLSILTMAPEVEERTHRMFGPIGRRMRFDAPERLTGWVEAAGLRLRDVRPTREGGYLHVSRKCPPAGHTIAMPGFRGTVLGTMNDIVVVEAEISGPVPAHRASEAEFLYILSGRVRMDMDGASREIGEGEHAVVPAGSVHGVTVEAPARVLLVSR
ncbi:MFS transporter [Azospirillum oleiclasticum]|uniref:MFS transporter n=1 Tax=Azospirillum oleiclasticum TaxID=2735135 RepID=UPI0031B5E5A0